MYKVDVVEALAALEAIKLAIQLGFCQVVFEGDASNVVEALRSMGPLVSNIVIAIDKAQRLASHFESVSFQHIRQNGNMVAHMLARPPNTLIDNCFG